MDGEKIRRYRAMPGDFATGPANGPGARRGDVEVYRCSDVDPILARARDVALLARGLITMPVMTEDLLEAHDYRAHYEVDEHDLPVLTPELREALEAVL